MNQQHIDTIPVWDAYKAGGECPLCELRMQNEANYIDSFLGASVMEPDTRVEVNKKGFCSRHFKMMFDSGNRLGLALMTHTYMKETMAALGQTQMSVNHPEKKSFFSRPKAPETDDLHGLSDTCILCDRLASTLDRYIYTILYMWKHETAFKEAFSTSKGFCLGHYADVLKAAPAHLSGRDLADFTATLKTLEADNLARVEKELEWFTLKFDYRNQDKPWGNSQDAVERAINKLRGKSV